MERSTISEQNIVPSIRTSNAYGGSLLHITVDAAECFSSPLTVRINGFVETIRTRTQHVTSPPLKMKSGELRVKIPLEIIPSFHDGHFKVWYELLIFSGAERVSQISLEIQNNNLADYTEERSIVLEAIEDQNEEYYKAKNKIAEILLDQFDKLVFTEPERSDNDIATTSTEEFPTVDISKLRQHDLSEINYTQDSFATPFFSHPNQYILSEPVKTVRVKRQNVKIAEIVCPAPLRRDSSLLFILNGTVKSMELVIYESLFEKNTLTNIKIVYNRAISVLNCLEKKVDLQFDGYSLATFAFRRIYTCRITLDDECVELDLDIVSGSTQYLYSQQ